MSNDQGIAGRLQSKQRIRKLSRHRRVGKFDQQVSFAIYRVAQWIGNCLKDVFRVQMEIATQAQFDDAVQQLAQLSKPLQHQLCLIGIAVARMRRADNACHAFLRSLIRHGQRRCQIGSSVVHPVDQMMMYVNQGVLSFNPLQETASCTVKASNIEANVLRVRSSLRTGRSNRL